jgi:branched-chain amino acid transport system permease protein
MTTTIDRERPPSSSGAPKGNMRSRFDALPYPVRGALIAALVLLLGFALPPLLNVKAMSIATDGALLGIYALSIGFLAHRLNLISLGHTAFYGGSAYMATIAVTHWGWSLEAGFFIAILAGTLLAVVFGALVVRSPGITFLMLTLALGQFMYLLSVRSFARPVTGAYDGLILDYSSSHSFFGVTQSEMIHSKGFWPFAWVGLVLVALILWLAGRSKLGRILEAIRENEERARFSGFNTFVPRLVAFTLTGFCASIGGALLALHTQFVSPDVLSFLTAGDGAIAAIVGGFAVLAGPVIGALIYTFAQSEFSSSGGYLQFYTGALLVLVLMFMRGGITGVVARWWSTRGSRNKGDGR